MADPIDAYDKLYCKCNGTGASFVDSSTSNPKTITANGNATQLPIKFNKSAGFFNGTSDYVSIPDSTDFDFAGAFTIEMFVNFSDVAAYSSFFGYQTLGQESLFHHLDNKIEWTITGETHKFSFDPSANTWYHIMWIRDGSGNLSINVDGSALTRTNGDGTSAGAVNHTGLFYIGFQGSQYMHGWIKELRISNVARTVAVPTTQYASDANTVLLMHFDTPATSPLAPAIAFDGTGDYLSLANSTDWNVSDVTVECWFKANAVSGTRYLFYRGNGTNDIISVRIGNTYTEFMLGASANNAYATWVPTANVWYHIAGVRKGSAMTLYINGQSVGTDTYADAISTTDAVSIGALPTGLAPFNGQIREFRFSNEARYDGPFTPSQTGFTVDANTKLYIKGDEDNGVTTFVDQTGKTVTTAGDTKIKYTEDYRSCIFKDEAGKFPYPVGSAKVDFFAIGSGVGYFDGSGDYLSVAQSSDFDFGSGDFTQEVYFRKTSSANVEMTIANKYASATGWIWLIAPGASVYIKLYHSGVGSVSVTLPSALNIYEWYHLAVVRSSTAIKFFLNGIQVGTDQTANATYDGGATSLIIGKYDTSSAQMIGLLDNIRISKGVARYTATFNPPEDNVSIDAEALSLSSSLEAPTYSYSVVVDDGAMTLELFGPSVTLSTLVSVSCITSTLSLEDPATTYDFSVNDISALALTDSIVDPVVNSSCNENAEVLELRLGLASLDKSTVTKEHIEKLLGCPFCGTNNYD